MDFNIIAVSVSLGISFCQSEVNWDPVFYFQKLLNIFPMGDELRVYSIYCDLNFKKAAEKHIQQQLLPSELRNSPIPVLMTRFLVTGNLYL